MLGALSLGAFEAAWLASGRALAQSLRGTLETGIDAAHTGLTPGLPDDQSKLLADALSLAESEGRPLVLPPGRYMISGIGLPRRAHMVGVPGRTVLALRGERGEDAALRARGAEMIRLEGLTFEGGGGSDPPRHSALLDIEETADLVLDDCAFENAPGAGARLRACAGRVDSSRFRAIGTIGLWLEQSRGMRAAGNVLEDCGDTGILVSRDDESEDGSLVQGNRVSRVSARSGGTGQNGNGINLSKANGVIVSGNRIDDCDFSAIRCFSSDSVSVTDNICTKSGEMALYVEFAFEGAVVSGNLIDGGNGGISFANFMEHGGRLGVCSGNIVRNIRGGPTYPDGNLQTGAGIAAEADMAITGNVIEDALWGLQLGWGPYLRNVSATGNVLRRTRIGIAVSVVEGAGTAIVADNLIDAAADGAIRGMRWAETATGELLDGDPPPANISLSGNRRT